VAASQAPAHLTQSSAPSQASFAANLFASFFAMSGYAVNPIFGMAGKSYPRANGQKPPRHRRKLACRWGGIDER
jgi:hypothetical protein